MGMKGDWGPMQKEALPVSVYLCRARGLGISGMRHREVAWVCMHS